MMPDRMIRDALATGGGGPWGSMSPRAKAARRRAARELVPIILLVLVGAHFVRGMVTAALAQERAEPQQLAAAQLNQVGNEVRARLEHVTEFIKGQQWEQAVQTLRRVMEDHGDDMIVSPAVLPTGQSDFATYISVTQYCQIQLATWFWQAPEALAIYRGQVDPLADRWYQQAISEHDEVRLQQIVDELLLSSSGDQALLQLGAMALERSNYILARQAWEGMNPSLRTTTAAAAVLGCTPGCPWWQALQGRDLDEIWPSLSEALETSEEQLSWLAYPDTEISLAALRARLAMVSILEGSRQRAELELEMLRRLHPNEQGRLAGGEGIYHQLVATELEASKSWHPEPRPAGWTTLAGDRSRNHVAKQEIDIALRPVWQTALPRLSARQDRVGLGRLRVAESRQGLLSYHVVADAGRVFIHQPGLLRGLDLKTGEPLWPVASSRRSGNEATAGSFFTLPEQEFEPLVDGAEHTGVPRYCLTVQGDYLVSRMGNAWADRDRTTGQDESGSCLVGIDLRTQKLLFDRLLPDQPGWEFETAPILERGRIFVSLRRHDAVSTQTRVACYAVETGRRLWETPVARGKPAGGSAYDLPNGALSFQDGLVFYSTRLGVIAALRASDGRREWICRYPRSGFAGQMPGQTDRHLFRDLSPSLIHRGLVISAPPDCARILAIDAGSGQLAWATAAERAVDAVHLLGVGSGRLLASGDYLYWIDVQSGKFVGQFPPPGSPGDEYAVPSPRGYGRGLLAGPYVYWPTKDQIRVFAQRFPREIRQPIELRALGLTGGNLVTEDGMMLIASADQLTAFNQTGSVDEAQKAATPKP